ncbi:MAG: NTP transferase domain-containing protein [Anaerolineae bacterium]
MDAVVTAGGMCKPDDPLFEITGVTKKALTPLAGKPMIQWVVGALLGARHIDRIVIVGMEAGEVDFGGAPIHYTPSRGSILDNVIAGAEALQAIDPSVKKFLLCSSDIPLITSEIVDSFIEDCLQTEADVYYSVVEEKTMEGRFPGSKRSFIPLKGGRYAGGDIFVIDLHAGSLDLDLFRELSQARKNYWRQALKLGPTFILKFLLRRLTLEEAARRASQVLNVRAVAMDTPYAELGMDLDKPHQYEMIKAELEASQA